jgi:hypothetical protein
MSILRIRSPSNLGVWLLIFVFSYVAFIGPSTLLQWTAPPKCNCPTTCPHAVATTAAAGQQPDVVAPTQTASATATPAAPAQPEAPPAPYTGPTTKKSSVAKGWQSSVASSLKDMPTDSPEVQALYKQQQAKQQAEAGKPTDPPTKKPFQKFTQWYPESSKADRALQCGTWSDEYVDLYEDIVVSNKRQPSFFVMSWTVQERLYGYADRMIGLISGFLFAIMLKRAFLIDRRLFPIIDMNELFSQPHIDWDFERINSRMNISTLPANIVEFVNPENKGKRRAQWFRNTPLRKIFGTAPVVYFSSNRGLIATLASVPWGQAFFQEYNMPPEHAFSCLFSFLFQVQPIYQERSMQMLRILSRPTHITYCIQIRMGDQYIKNWNVETKKFTARMVQQCAWYLQCSNEHIQLSKHTKPIQYFLVSDTPNVKAYLRKKLGSLLYTYENQTKLVGHTAEEPIHWKLKQLFYNVVTEQHLLFHGCDYHVVTGLSGYGGSRSLARGPVA